MKALFSLILICSVCYCSNHGSRHPKNYGITRKSQIHDTIERPCALHDVDCIRRVFAHNSRCKPVRGPASAPDPLVLDSLPIHMAYANMTFTLKNIQVKGLNNWEIKEFYINKATDKLVLEVEFDAIAVFSPQTIARYYRKGKEPVELSDYSVVIYKGISLTLTVPNIKNLQLSSAQVYSYILDANPPYRVGPGMKDDSDPELTAEFNAMTGNIPIGLREVFVYKGPVFMSVFLQSVICDFSYGGSLH